MMHSMRMGVAALALAGLILLGGSPATAGVFQTGGNRLAAMQNNNGGWDVPLDDGNPNSGSSPATFGPTGVGLAYAYLNTGLAGQYAALQKASSYLSAKVNDFTVFDGYLAAMLDQTLGGTAHRNYVKSAFYDKLAAGTYAGGYTTASYIAWIRANYGNLAAWDLGIGIASAAKCGAPTAAWIQGTEDAVNELDNTDYYHVLGLGGAVYGLSYAGAVFDPTSGSYASAGSVADLANILKSYQMSSGGLTWWEGQMTPGVDESVQETAYAILALNQVNPVLYGGEIVAAVGWLQSVQLATGGWEYYPGYASGEDNQATGEAMWGLGAVTPVPEPASLALLGLAALACVRRRGR